MPDYLFAKKALLKSTRKDLWIIYLYRYASCFLTSFFYLIGPPRSNIAYKAGVIVSLILAAIIINNLYIKFGSSSRSLVILEMIGTNILLIYTGGLGSPLIWYALNLVLVTACFYSYLVCWGLLLIYITSATTISFFLYNADSVSLFSLLYDNTYLIMVLILGTLVIQLLFWLTKQLSKQAVELSEQKEKLIDINNRLNDSMETLMSLYQVVENFNTLDLRSNVSKTFAAYSCKLTRSCLSFVRTADKGSDDRIDFAGSADNRLRLKITEDFKTGFTGSETCLKEYLDHQFLLTPIESSSGYYGILGIEVKDYYENEHNYRRQIKFLSELCALVLDRYQYQDISSNLLIAEEQNRIANEMHDSISQRLFSIVYALHALSLNCNSLQQKEIKYQIDLIKESANTTMKELRTTIYHLSSKMKDLKCLFNAVNEYLSNIRELNNINTYFKYSGDEYILNFRIKNALYRIICEAVGNAVKHGVCDEIYISLDILEDIALIIRDNGKGFELDSTGTGLGIYNMNSLVRSLNGIIHIQSAVGIGTEINIKLPYNTFCFQGGNYEDIDC